MRPSGITACDMGMMLFVQVIVGRRGCSEFLIIYHLVWGTLTFAVLVIADFVVQGILGLISLASGLAVVVHPTNPFLLGVIVTYLISFAYNADKAFTSHPTQTQPL